MPEVREVFGMATKEIEPDVDAWRTQQRRQRRRSRNRRMGAFAVVVVLAAAAVIAVRALPYGGEDRPAATLERPENGVALVALDGTIVGTMGAEGSAEVATLMLAGPLNGLSLSPDGSRVVVSDGTEIFTMDVDGTGLTKLADGGSPAWSPDGSSIAFAGNGIHVVSPDGTGRRTIVASDGAEVASPAWSPDGERIAYNIGGQTEPRHGIYVVEVDGGQPTRLTRQWDGLPSWHPDGSTIAFTRIGVSDQDLYTVPSDGSARATPLIAGDRSEGSGIWSPSGDLLAYWAFEDAYETNVEEVDVHVLDTRTGEDRVILEGGAPIGWASDGTLLVAF